MEEHFAIKSVDGHLLQSGLSVTGTNGGRFLLHSILANYSTSRLVSVRGLAFLVVLSGFPPPSLLISGPLVVLEGWKGRVSWCTGWKTPGDSLTGYTRR